MLTIRLIIVEVIFLQQYLVHFSLLLGMYVDAIQCVYLCLKVLANLEILLLNMCQIRYAKRLIIEEFVPAEISI